jgi:predicted exporter
VNSRIARAAAFAVALAALAAYAFTHVRIGADFSAFLPAGANAGQRALVSQLREGAAGRLLLIALGGEEPASLARASRALAQALLGAPQFRYAANGDAAQGERDLQFIVAHRYALSRGVDAERFSVEGLRAALAQRLEGLYGSAAPLEKRTLAQDPTGETLAVLRALVPARMPRSVDGVWFDDAGTRALLLAETSAPASDIDGQAAALAALQAAHAKAAPRTSIEWTSPGALAVASRELIAHQARVLSVVSAVLIVGVLAFTYRAPRPVLLCALPAAVGLLAGVCAVYAVLGRLNGITLAFGATLLGEAVDYPSFLFTQVAPGESPAAARTRVGPLLRLAVLTTACGSLALLLSGFPGLIELGLLALVGILVAGAVTWWVVADWVPHDLGRSMPSLRATRAPHLALGRGARAALVAVIFAALALGAARHAWFDDDLAHLNPLPAEAAARDRALRDALGAPDVRSLVIVRAATDEEVLERAERLRGALADAVRAGELDGFDLVSDYLPSTAAQARRRASLPDAATLARNLDAAMQGSPFRAGAFDPFLRDVAAARDAPPLTARDLAGTALGLRLRSLLDHDAEGAYAVVPLRGLRNPEAVAARVRALQDPAVAWLDLRAESASMLAGYRQQALVSTAAGVTLIGLVLALGLRSVPRALAVLAPVVAATVLTAMLLVAANVALTIFHLVALLLVVGIGVNYALFAERLLRQASEAPRVLRTLLVVSATTLCAFATLAVSSIPVLRALGLTVCVGVLACLALVALVWLPDREVPA